MTPEKTRFEYRHPEIGSLLNHATEAMIERALHSEAELYFLYRHIIGLKPSGAELDEFREYVTRENYRIKCKSRATKRFEDLISQRYTEKQIAEIREMPFCHGVGDFQPRTGGLKVVPGRKGYFRALEVNPWVCYWKPDMIRAVDPDFALVHALVPLNPNDEDDYKFIANHLVCYEPPF